MNQTYSGRSRYHTDVEEVSGTLLLAVRCVVGSSTEEDIALLDTASQWCVLPPSVALELGFDVETEGNVRVHTRFGLLAGELLRLPVAFVAEEGERGAVEATWFLSPDWPGPVVIGWKGCLERMRFAFDPSENDFYFAEL
jgi:hypothetical protein